MGAGSHYLLQKPDVIHQMPSGAWLFCVTVVCTEWWLHGPQQEGALCPFLGGPFKMVPIGFVEGWQMNRVLASELRF